MLQNNQVKEGNISLFTHNVPTIKSGATVAASKAVPVMHMVNKPTGAAVLNMK